MMCIIKKWAVVACLLPLQAFSQQDSVLSLNEILDQINQSNIQLQSYGLKAKSYAYTADAATAWMPPMVGVGTFMTPLPGQMKMQPSDAGSLMLRLEQEIPSGGKLKAKKRYIESQAPIELAAREEAFNNLKALAKSQYYAWLIASQRVKVLQRNVEVMEMMKKVEEVRYPYNQSQLSSVFQASARLEENLNMIRMQEGTIGRARAVLNGLMNRPGNQKFGIDTVQEPRFVTAQFDTASLAAARADVLRMNQSIRSMELNIAAMRQQRKPDFKIQYDQMLPFDAAMPKSYSVMGMISIPIAPWSSKMYKSDIKAMEYNIHAMEKERDAMLQESQGMLYGMQAEIASMQQRIRSMETKVIPSLQNALDANVLNYRENKVQLPLVIQTWDALNMMQMDLLDEKLKLYQMIIDYEKEFYR
ncbi:TolC family protein [Paracnuella aquatica]|uniref:TolC family protein n=1 Tax=Paracnuella aquatica TaxID=2268757 RepID=UPI0019D4C9A1|nr:TolC family protein [Paracnuella aquatica]